MIKNNYAYYALRDIKSGKLLNANSRDSKFFLNKKYALQALKKYNSSKTHLAELVIFKLIEDSEEDS